jgi:DNA (cytosine-5)-methyltransferase 1
MRRFMGTDTLSVIDLFCGTGGFSQGFLDHSPSFVLKYAIDRDATASATARANHPDVIVETNDIRAVSPESVQSMIRRKRIDVLIGGPPCQGFSSLRPNRSSGEDDERNNLFLRFAHFAEAFRPKLVVLENVVGLLTHRDGETLERVVDAFARLKYRVDWRILNAASFGVPQKRERFVMIASRDEGPVVFPEPTHSFAGRVIGFKDKSRYLLAESSRPAALTVDDAISDLPRLHRGQEAVSYDKEPISCYQAARRAGALTLSLHRAANHSDKMMKVIELSGPSISSIPKHLITSGFSSCYSRLAADEPATTITVKFQSPASNKCIHPTQNRTITPREAARLQSFDDSYVFVGPLTSVASQIGNAVPPLLGRAIAASVVSSLT